MLPHSKYTHRKRGVNRRRGFTLVEILVSMTILTMLLAGVIPFFVTNFKYLYSGEQKLLINSDIRDLTNEMVENARASNYFVLYESFYQQSLGGSMVRRDMNGNGTVNLNDRLQAGQEGSFVVFVFYNDPYFDTRLYDGDPTNNPALMTVTVARVVGYWVAPNREIPGETALYVFDSDDSRGAGTTWTTPWAQTFPVVLGGTVTVESLLPTDSQAWAMHSSAEIVVNDMEGLTSNSLFFENFQNRSVLIRTKILHGNQAKRVTNTYNFTITPRG